MKRYSLQWRSGRHPDSFGDSEMTWDPEGDWVRWEDVAYLLSEAATTIQYLLVTDQPIHPSEAVAANYLLNRLALAEGLVDEEGS